jgi:hypothetical protein
MTTPGSLRNLRNDSSTTSTSRWRRTRSTANMFEQFSQPAPPPQKPAPAPQKASPPPATKPAPKLERASSKMSLFNLFSRPKVEKARGHTEVGLAVPMRPQTPPKPAPVSPPKSALRHNPPPAAQQLARSRSSQLLRPMSSMSLRPNTVKPEKTESDHWSPPPLFQAYPQSIKYATVQACVYSPDVLLRTQSQRKQYEAARERMDSHRDLSAILENGAEVRKLEKNHRRLVSNSIMNPSVPQLTNKVYVLVTSGYVLQYSGDGPFDRLPEKVLKLGKESAAFACDLIPGKHWVLQISQSASEDGTVAIGPKSTLLSRLRLQNSSSRRAATTFLLVLENPDEMNAWMSSIRKEIDSLGGGKPRDEAERESTSIEESGEKQSHDNASITSHRYQVQRDPKRVSKMVDSPLQSQYSDSPKIVASDWEGTRSEKTVSIVGSASIQSSRQSTKRNSVEASSIATTPMSHDQLQLDQLRERSRYSYVSTATSVSGTGTGTRNTSRNSSPAPISPLKEGFSPADAEPLRSATSLRSFHMNPGNTITTRRRSMQPLPVTNEDSSLSAVTISITPQRHSIYGPTSPTFRKPEDAPTLKASAPTTAPAAVRNPSPVLAATPAPAPIPSAVPAPEPPKSQLAPLLINPTPRVRYSTQPPVRSSARSSSAPPARYGAISPPPREPAPGPPGRPQSTIGALSSATITPIPHSDRRLSSGPKPFLRPFPVRPQAQHVQQRDSTFVVPKRMSSLGPAPMSLGAMATPNRSVTAPVRPPSASAPHPDPIKGSPPQPQLRRPNSVQIRSDHAPFLSSSRPTAGSAPVRRVVSSTPSFFPGTRASTTFVPTTVPPTTTFTANMSAPLQPSPSISTMRQQAKEQAQLMQEKGIVPRRSMPVLGLPPPAPPPDMPLPPPPPMSATRGIVV